MCDHDDVVVVVGDDVVVVVGGAVVMLLSSSCGWLWESLIFCVAAPRDLRVGTNIRTMKTIKTDSSIFSVGSITCLQWDENKVIVGTSDKSVKMLDMVSGM